MPRDHQVLGAADARLAQIVHHTIREGDKMSLNRNALGDTLAYLVPALRPHTSIDASTVADELRDLRGVCPYFFDTHPEGEMTEYNRQGRKLTPQELSRLTARERLDVINEAAAKKKGR